MSYIDKARILGTLYDMQDTATAENVANLESAIGAKIQTYQGSFENGVWTDSRYGSFVKVIPGSNYRLERIGISLSAPYLGLKSAALPPTVGDQAVLSEAEGWTGARQVASGDTETGVIPDDVMYLYFYGYDAQGSRMPTKIVINGISILDSSVCDDIAALADNAKKADAEISGLSSDTEDLESAVSGLSERVGEKITILHGSYTADGWANGTNYGAFVEVIPGSRYTFARAAASSTSPYFGLKSATVPPADGDQPVKSEAQGWTEARTIANNSPETGVIPDDVHYLYFYAGTNTNYTRLPTTIIINGIDILDGDVYDDIAALAKEIDEITHPAITKTIAFMGDSITAGSGWTGQPESQGYHQYIHDLYGFTCLNYGYGGSGYVNSYSGTSGVRGTGEPGRGVSNSSGGFTPNNIRARLGEITPANVDGVVIFAGTNDWSAQVAMADFKAELDTVYDYYQNNFGSVPLLVMTPIHRLDDADTSTKPIPLIDYVDAIIEKCRAHGIPYIDTFCVSGLQPNNSGNSAVFFPRDDNQSHTIDGVHPNHLAHQKLARCIGETLNQMVLWNEKAVR